MAGKPLRQSTPVKFYKEQTLRADKNDKKNKRSKRQDSRYNADSDKEWKPPIEGNYNNINSHNFSLQNEISGSYNVVNQQLGPQSIFSLTPRELADEWVHSSETIKKERKKRLRTGATVATITVLIIVLLLLANWRWDILRQMLNLESVSDFSVNVLASLVAAIITAPLSKFSWDLSTKKSRVELTNRERRMLIADRVRDLGVGAKEWKQLKRLANDKRAK